MSLACTTKKGKKMAVNSKKKGARFERELAGIFRDYGYQEARRTAQYCGNTGDASDVVGLPLIHVEAKHQEQMRLYDWMDQAKRDAAAIEQESFLLYSIRKTIIKSLLRWSWMIGCKYTANTNLECR